MMTKKEMNDLATLVSKAVVTALKEASAPSTSANEGRRSATPEAPKTKYSTKLSDYEPKGEKTAKGYTNWNSYCSKRSDYCYAVATNGKYLGCYENGKKVVDFADIKKKYDDAKKKYEAKFVYVKKADR